MAIAKVFIDGEHGTTGLQIRQRLEGRDDISLISLEMDDRHDIGKRRGALNQADIAILCLPDEAAIGALKMTSSTQTRFIDASTAHRTDPAWIYGFAELDPFQKNEIRMARYVSNPGCYATGAIALLAPLIAVGLMNQDEPITINAVSGYSGGGKGMIAQMQDQSRDDAITSNYFAYALTLAHKHVPEIMEHAGLTRRPIFMPSVGRFMQGMAVNIPIHTDLMDSDAFTLHAALEKHYENSEFVYVMPMDETKALTRISPEDMATRNDMVIHVCASEDGKQANLIALLDNLGKGASGAAVQNLNLMLEGFEATAPPPGLQPAPKVGRGRR